jgi:hypothetical protein
LPSAQADGEEQQTDQQTDAALAKELLELALVQAGIVGSEPVIELFRGEVAWDPRVGTSSVFTFATTNRPAVSLATLRSSGATILHGPHHGAQKSTSTGRVDRLVSASNAKSLGTSTGSLGGGSTRFGICRNEMSALTLRT